MTLLASALLRERNSFRTGNYIGVVLLDLTSAHDKNLKGEGEKSLPEIFSEEHTG